MIKSVDQFHGSDLEKVEKIYGIKREDILPFAANVNPLGLSSTLKEALASHLDILQEYPERDYLTLRNAIGEYIDCSPNCILPGVGSTELISTMIHAIKPHKALVVEPTYSEYKRDLKELKCEIEDFFLKEENRFLLNPEELCKHIDDSVDMVILCNPNNPTSTCITISQIQVIAEACKAHSAFLFIDETYVEFVKEYQRTTAIPLIRKYNNLVVVRSVSKFFAAPGLRLGYACTSNDKLLNYINRHGNPWGISSIAAFAGTVMFKDQAYIQATREMIHQEQSLVCSALRARKSLDVFEPATNFVLIKLNKEGLTSGQAFDLCMKQGLMIRDCSSFPGLNEQFIRFCFLTPQADDRLVNAILSFA